MMKTFLLSLFMIITLNTFGQGDPNTGFPIYLSFEISPYYSDTPYVYFELDTTYENNIWQVGPPQKSILNAALSPNNVIITDTINSYPVNDTSSFIVKCSVAGGALSGSYFCDTDSLNDYGLIELSIDSGQTWINILEDSILNDDVAAGFAFKPILTGRSDGWQYFDLNSFFNQLSPQNNDNYWVKFTFISDSIDTGQEGLMFDELLVGILANTNSIYQLNTLNVFPNPTTNLLNFQLEEPIQNAQIRIYSTLGQLIETQNINDINTQINVSDWYSGVYFYGVYVEGQLVKQGQLLIRN